jgi:hypothetical protein
MKHAAELLPGAAMSNDHRRILATGMARLRAKIKYRPVVFELMPEEFSLLQLQQTVEALAGRGLHKQNFRRLIEQQALVEDRPDDGRRCGPPGQAVPLPTQCNAGARHCWQQAAAGKKSLAPEPLLGWRTVLTAESGLT